MEVFKGRPLQNLQLHQPLNLQPSHSLMKRSVLGVSSDYSVRCGKSSLPTVSLEVPSSMQLSLEGTALKKVRLMNDSLCSTELKLSNKFLENLSILKGFKTSDDFDKTKTQKLANTADQGTLHSKSSLLKGWHVVLDLDKSSFKERLDLKNEILSHGGTVGFSVTKKTTHLLVNGIQKRSFSFKRHCAKRYSVKVVSVNYVRDCLESGSVLNVESYIAADKVQEIENKENNLLSGKIKALGKQRRLLQEKPEKSKEEEELFVWEDFENKADYQIAKFCFMKHLDSESRHMQIELHVLTEPVARRYRIYCQFQLEDKSMVEKCFSLSSSMQAVAVYCKITRSLRTIFSAADVKSEKFGSPKFQKMQMETHTISADTLSTSVKTVVDIVWKEAIGTASASVDITSVTTEKVNKAVVTLAQIKRMLVEGGASEKQLEDKSKQFYSQICHKGINHDAIDTKRKINQMQELCTLLQDVMNVQEASNWKKDVNITNKYRSLRCNIKSVDRYSSQYQTVMRIIGKEAMESSRIQVTNVYSLTRPLEDSIFSPKGRKVTSLVHATRPTSLLGILSRGLLPPKIVQEDVGIDRRDYGFLGQGIYFGDDIRSNIHFTEPNGCTKTRFLLMCEVIVGKQYKTWQHQPDLVNPPAGYDSVLGVKNSDGNHSMFKHNEYTIYDVGQQRLSYLIEFVQVNETPVIYQPEFSTADVEEPRAVEEKNKDIDVSDVMDVSDPLDKVTPGLQTSGGQPVLLERVSVKAKMMDLVAQVTVFQRYRNTNTKPIEAKYVFPLDDTAAVCGFEAFIGDKHIVGEVKEKETAHKEYREAVSQGHGAYLMDEESADVFTVSVGNLPPSTEVIIKIIYVVELSLDDDQIVFHLPGSLASWRKEGALAEETQNVTSTVSTGDEKIKFEMSLSMEMPFDIQTIQCSTHDIKIKRTAAKACITLAEGEDCLKEGFHLSVKLHKIHQPHMWVEQNPNDKDSQACMLTFYPEFEVPRLKKPDITVVLDCSNSMKGESFEHAKKICYMVASLMPKNYRFNIVKFGTNFKELYPSSHLASKIDFNELKDFLAGASPAEGNTDVWRPLHSHYLLEGENLRNVFIISDGHISNETETLKSIAKNSSHTRIFTFGVSTTCNKHMLKIMARSGAGSFEFFDGKTKSAWQRKVKNQLQRAGQPSVNSLSIKWHQFDTYAPKPRQAPRHLGALFGGSRLVVFGIVPYCTSATLTAVIDGQEISTIVSTSDLCITKGLTLHRLTARALIRDWEDGTLDMDRIEEEITKEKEKQAIISLSRQYSIVTSLTSFVAIEKREKHEVQKKLNMEEKLKELLQKEDVDVLPYMDWQHRQEVTLDLDDKEKWDEEPRQDKDGIGDETSSSDEDSIENLPSVEAVMDCAVKLIRHFDGEGSSSSESEAEDSSSSSSSDMGYLMRRPQGFIPKRKHKKLPSADDEIMDYAEEADRELGEGPASSESEEEFSFGFFDSPVDEDSKSVEISGDDEGEYDFVAPAAVVPLPLELEEEESLEFETLLGGGDEKVRLFEAAKLTCTLDKHDADVEKVSRKSQLDQKKKSKEDPLDRPAKLDKRRKRRSRSRSRGREPEVAKFVIEEGKESEERMTIRSMNRHSGHVSAASASQQRPPSPSLQMFSTSAKSVSQEPPPSQSPQLFGSSSGSATVQQEQHAAYSSQSYGFGRVANILPRQPTPQSSQWYGFSAASTSQQQLAPTSSQMFGSSFGGATLQQQCVVSQSLKSYGFSAASTTSQQQPAPASSQMFGSSAASTSQQPPAPQSSQMFGSSFGGATLQPQQFVAQSSQSYGFPAASTSQQPPAPQSSQMFGSSFGGATLQQQQSVTQSSKWYGFSAASTSQQQPTPQSSQMFGSSAANDLQQQLQSQRLLFASSEGSALQQQQQHPLPSSTQTFGFSLGSASQPQPPQQPPTLFGFPKVSTSHQPQQQPPSSSPQLFGSSRASASRQSGYSFLTQPLLMDVQTTSLSHEDIGQTPPPSRHRRKFAARSVRSAASSPSVASQQRSSGPESRKGSPQHPPPQPVYRDSASLQPPAKGFGQVPARNARGSLYELGREELMRPSEKKRELKQKSKNVYLSSKETIDFARKIKVLQTTMHYNAHRPLSEPPVGGGGPLPFHGGGYHTPTLRSAPPPPPPPREHGPPPVGGYGPPPAPSPPGSGPPLPPSSVPLQKLGVHKQLEQKQETHAPIRAMHPQMGGDGGQRLRGDPHIHSRKMRSISALLQRDSVSPVQYQEKPEVAMLKRKQKLILMEQRMIPVTEEKKQLPVTEEALTDEPGVDSKFEIFKVPQLRKFADQTSVFNLIDAAVKLCQKMHGKCFAKHEEVLELLGITEKTFLEFFRHVGIYSLGQVAAEAFLTFFTTWLVYVFINVVVKRATTDPVIQSAKTKDTLARMKLWLNQQGGQYSVKDYYLGLSSWDEVAREMLGFKMLTTLV